jgi:methionyl-tRNA formyltransferase
MWAILNNLQQGATTYFVNEKIDEGKIVDIVRLEKGNLNSYEAYQMLSNKVIENIINCIEKIEKKEDLSAPVGFNRYHKKGMPNDGYVSWSWSLNFIKRFSDSLIFPPYKPMSTMYRGMTINLTCHNINVIDILNVENGTILSKKGTRIEVKASNGIAECELDKDIKIKIGDVFSYKSGYNHTIEENFSEDYIR